MKLTFSSGIFCVLFGALAGFAQQAPPSGGQVLSPDQPVSQDQPASPQQPPAQQPPPDQQPPPPVTAPGTPSIPKPTVQLPPSVPPVTPTPPQERDTGGDGFSIMAAYWINNDQPVMRAGGSNYTLLPGDLHFTGNKKYSYAGVITIPTSRENSLEFTYMRKQGFGTSVISETSNFFGNNFAAGDAINTRYTLQTMKLSWNYLTWPYPSNGAKLRVKTLYEVQYVNIGTTFDAPLDPDAVPTSGSKSVILPTLGAGVEYHPAKNIRLEMKASGFGIPHHSDIWDVQAAVVFRYSRFEILLSEKAYHYKTGPYSDQYFTQTLIGPFFGLRYLFK